MKIVKKDKTMENNTYAIIAILATVILGFLGVFVMLFQMNSRFERIEDKIDTVNSNLSSRLDAVNANLSSRIDAVNSRLDSLYRELFKKDAA